MNKVPEMPAWTADLPGTAYIGNPEICQIYGLNPTSVGVSAERGTIPKPAFICARSGGRGHCKLKWLLRDIRRDVAAKQKAAK